MSDAEILAGIHAVARQHLQFEGELRPEDPLVETLRLDSLRLLTLVAEIENHFRVVFEPEDEAGLVHVHELVALVRRRLG